MTDDTVPSQGVLEIADRLEAENLIIDIDGFEGPLDLLLSLSRSQKVDLLKISVLELARQYLDFIEQAKALRIELAADYLVMAAWLAYLKSRLLLPPEQQDDGPTGEELAAHLAFQLERLQAMRSAAAQLMARDQKGRNFFQRGVPEKFELVRRVTYTASLLDLMQAYSRVRTRDEFRPFVMDRQNVFTMEEALERLRGLVGYALDWVDLASYLPSDWTDDPLRRRAATAATFAASLELAKAGRVEIRQRGTFEPIELKRKTAQTSRMKRRTSPKRRHFLKPRQLRSRNAWLKLCYLPQQNRCPPRRSTSECPMDQTPQKLWFTCANGIRAGGCM